MLEKMICELIDSGKEGDYWDFKQKHYSKSGDLIKDIICLANTVRHKGDRYLIFGVNDNGDIVGVPPEDRKTQADIVSTLSKAGFVGGIYPDIHLQEIQIHEHILDILIIKDTPEKPFYLQKDFSSKGVTLRAGTIYSRVRDSNTANDHVASASDIERMWRERFGLIQQPYERLLLYLLDYDNWEEMEEENYWYYKPFPEFTIQRSSDLQEIEDSDSWVKAAINPTAYFFQMSCKYLQTPLMREICVYYDEMRFLIPNPDLTTISKAKGPNYFYYFTLDTAKSNLLSFLKKKSKPEILEDACLSDRMHKIPVLIIENEEYLTNFKNYIAANPSLLRDTSYEKFTPYDRHSDKISDFDKEIINFGQLVAEIYKNWKNDI